MSQVFSRDLEKDVAGDTSGYFKKFLTSLLQVKFIVIVRTSSQESAGQAMECSLCERYYFHFISLLFPTNDIIDKILVKVRSIERFSIECRKTKTKVITTAN